MTDFKRYNKTFEYIKRTLDPLIDAFKTNPTGTFRCNLYASYRENDVRPEDLWQMVPEYLMKDGFLELGMFPCYADNGPFAKPCMLTRTPEMLVVGKRWDGLDEIQYQSNWKYTSRRLGGIYPSIYIITVTVKLTLNDLKRYNIYEKYINIE